MTGYVRGAPSAISIAVIPNDHKSLCNDRDTVHEYSCEWFKKKTQQTDRQTDIYSADRRTSTHLEVVRGVGVLVTGDDLGRHPIRRPDESVPPSHCSVQLGRNTEVHCGTKHTHTHKQTKHCFSLCSRFSVCARADLEAHQWALLNSIMDSKQERIARPAIACAHANRHTHTHKHFIIPSPLGF